MSFRDFFKPRRTPGRWHANLAVQLAASDPSWERGREVRPPRPIFSNLTESEIDLSLAFLNGSDEYDPRER